MQPARCRTDVRDSQDTPHDFYSAAQSQALRRRKVDRACDACRRRKTRCDGPKMPNNCCSNCLQSGKSCTYVESSKPRGPPKAYVIGLENRMEKLEAMLTRLYPGIDFSDELGPPVIRDCWRTELTKQQIPSSDATKTNQSMRPSPDRHLDELKTPLHLLPELRLSSSAQVEHEHYRHRGRDAEDEFGDSDSPCSSGENSNASDSDAMARSSATALTLRGAAERVDFAEDPHTVRFHGRTSVHGLVDATRKYRRMLLNQSGSPSVQAPIGQILDEPPLCRYRRPYYWRSPTRELTWEGYISDPKGFPVDVLAQFPPPELAHSLVNLYFKYINDLLPLLHRPTFERQFKDQLYEQDIWFAGVCLGMFAVASRFSDDPRVVPPNAKTPSGDVDWCKAGWDYFNMSVDIHRVRRSLFLPATLCEMQTFTLMSLFLRSSSANPAAWPVMAVGLRKAQDVGAHRKKMYREKVSVDGELWKRAFWFLVLLDFLGATTLGRPCCINQEDYDLDLPLEVDDEYWETRNPAEAFKQPRGVPSKISAFNCYIKIGWILGFIQKTLYGIDKSASFVPKNRSRAEQILKDIETALDEWLTSIPEHLKWSDNMDPVFADQSSLMYLIYYTVQIIVYRPFTTRPSDSSAKNLHQADPCSLAVKALRASTAAARSIVRVIKAQKTARIVGAAPEFYASYYAAGQLLLRIWDLKAQEKAQKERQDKDNFFVQFVDDLRDSSKLSLTKEIDELVDDVYSMMDLYEGAQARWEFVQPILERLKESLPKDGEMRQPDIWYQTTPRYFNEDSPVQDSSSPVPSDPQTFSYPIEPCRQQESSVYPSAQIYSYPTVVNDFSAPLTQVPTQRKPSQGQPALQDFMSLGLLTRKTADPSFAQSWPENTSQTTQFDPRLYYMPDEPEIDDRSAIDQTTVRSSVSYQIPAANIFTPAGYSLSYGNPFTAENQQTTVIPSAVIVDSPALPTFPENHYGLGVAPENDHYRLRGNLAAVPRYVERHSDSAGQSALPHIPSQRLVWPANEPNPFLSQSAFYGKDFLQ